MEEFLVICLEGVIGITIFHQFYSLVDFLDTIKCYREDYYKYKLNQYFNGRKTIGEGLRDLFLLPSYLLLGLYYVIYKIIKWKPFKKEKNKK